MWVSICSPHKAVCFSIGVTWVSRLYCQLVGCYRETVYFHHLAPKFVRFSWFQYTVDVRDCTGRWFFFFIGSITNSSRFTFAPNCHRVSVGSWDGFHRCEHGLQSACTFKHLVTLFRPISFYIDSWYSVFTLHLRSTGSWCWSYGISPLLSRIRPQGISYKWLLRMCGCFFILHLLFAIQPTGWLSLGVESKPLTSSSSQICRHSRVTWGWTAPPFDDVVNLPVSILMRVSLIGA